MDLEAWLKDRSTAVERRGAELVFRHQGGGTSVLLPRQPPDPADASLLVEPLAPIYRNFLGASIGDSQLTFATSVAGGVEISHGFRLPDFAEMATQTRALGIEVGPSERVFLAEADWMFVYTVSSPESGSVLRLYDRDYGTSRVIESLEVVLDQWWQIVLDDLPLR